MSHSLQNPSKTLFFLLAMLLGGLGLSWADSPAMINYQGKLADVSGNPVTNPGVTMVFGIYPGADPATFPTPLFTDTRTNGVPVTNGVFNVLIGTGSIGGSTPDLRQTLQSSATLYLQVTVNGTALLPRQRLVASPYALSVAPGAVGTLEVSTISASKLNAGTFQIGNYSFSGSTVTVSSMSVTGVIDMNGQPIQNLPTTPVNPNDAASKDYVDTHVASGEWSTTGSTVYLTTGSNSVGLGLSNPVEKLSVDGSARIFNISNPSLLIMTDYINLSGILSQWNTTSHYGFLQTYLGNVASNNLAFQPLGGSVSIGTTTATAALDVNGNVRIQGSSASLPVANASNRGTVYVLQGGAGVTDKIYMCLKTSADTYQWVMIGRGD